MFAYIKIKSNIQTFVIMILINAYIQLKSDRAAQLINEFPFKIIDPNNITMSNLDDYNNKICHSIPVHKKVVSQLNVKAVAQCM